MVSVRPDGSTVASLRVTEEPLTVNDEKRSLAAMCDGKATVVWNANVSDTKCPTTSVKASGMLVLCSLALNGSHAGAMCVDDTSCVNSFFIPSGARNTTLNASGCVPSGLIPRIVT